jgi:hypothetical protein
LFDATASPAAATEATRRTAMASSESGDLTGTKDKDYNILWFTENCLDNALRLEPTSKTPTAMATPNSPGSSARLRPKAARAPSRASTSSPDA